MSECQHEKLIPMGNEPDWNLINWDEKPEIGNEHLKVNMCKKCHLLYWENKI